MASPIAFASATALLSPIPPCKRLLNGTENLDASLSELTKMHTSAASSRSSGTSSTERMTPVNGLISFRLFASVISASLNGANNFRHGDIVFPVFGPPERRPPCFRQLHQQIRRFNRPV